MTGATNEIRSRPNIRFRQVGRPLTRTDAPGKVTGRTPYAGDYVMPGMLHMRVVRADIASARLARLDVSRARALEGVACVLTAADLPDRTASTDIPGQVGRKRLDTGAQVLVRERVRYFGEPLALIAAETRDIADHAMELVEFELEPIAGVYDPLEAMKPGAPVVTEPDNIVAERRIRKGDVEAGFAASRRHRREHVPHPVPGARLSRARGRPRVGRRERRGQHPRLHPGHRALPAHRRRHRGAPQQGPHPRRAGRRRLRRQGGPHRRGLPGPARQAHRPSGTPGVHPRGLLRGPRQAPSVHPHLPHRGHEGREDHRAGRDDGGRFGAPTCS